MYTHMYINIQRRKHTYIIYKCGLPARSLLTLTMPLVLFWTPLHFVCLGSFVCRSLGNWPSYHPNGISIPLDNAFVVVATAAVLMAPASNGAATGLQHRIYPNSVVVAVTPLAMVVDMVVEVVVDMVVAKNSDEGLD